MMRGNRDSETKVTYLNTQVGTIIKDGRVHTFVNVGTKGEWLDKAKQLILDL